jgi:60 kDa SS-A/Ro ribonucleoprotein
MANKSIFRSVPGSRVPATNTVNREGAPAYRMKPYQALAQLAVTGTFNRTFYAGAGEQLDEVLELAWQVQSDYLAKTAVYAFEQGRMKDMPALLLAVLSAMEGNEFNRAFPRIVRNGKMLRTFVQMIRSGVAGRKSLGTRPKRLVQAWLETASDAQLMRAAVGNQPSLADVIKMVHPKPKCRSREAFFGYLIGKPYDVGALPEVVKAFEAFKRDRTLPVPDVPFQMLTALELTKEHWVQIAEKAGWQMLRQNLNTFARNGVFDVPGFTGMIAGRLRDPDTIRRAGVLPYQVMVACQYADQGVPYEVYDALQDAMEIALERVPKVEGRVVVCPDVSGSMQSPVTGYRPGATTAVRCVDVAALVAAAMLRTNPETVVLPFERTVVDIRLNPRDTVLTNARKLAAVGGGGTNCSAPLEWLVEQRAKVDLVVFVSDNQSCVDATEARHLGTGMMANWHKLKVKNPKAKLVCIDIQPYTASQAVERADILNVGGFSDQVFTAIAQMVNGGSSKEWTRMINAVEL